MKKSGNHKHDKDNIEGLHSHEYEELEEEGIKLLVKGKLKNVPEISFKKPKTEKQKKDAKETREAKKQNKKNELTQLVEDIEKNFDKFQGKKQLAQQGVQQTIPIYIPQYTPPSGKNLNTDYLSEINNMILEKENELKEYYEKEFNQKWSEIEEAYNILEDKEVERIRQKALEITPQLTSQLIPSQQTEYIPEEVEITPQLIPSQQTEVIPEEVEITPQLTPSQQTEVIPEEESLEDKVVGLLDLFDNEVLSKFREADPNLKNLEELNEEQEEIIDTKEIELKKQQQLIEEIEEERNQLLKEMEMIPMMEQEYAEALQQIQEREDIIFELNGVVDKTKEELDNLKFMNQFKEDRTEEQQKLIDENITSPAEQQLIKRDIENSTEYLALSSLGIPKNLIPLQKSKLRDLYLLVRKTNEEDLNFILETKPKSQKQFYQQLSTPRKDILEIIKKKEEEERQQEEERQKQIINEMVETAESEELSENLFKITQELVLIQKSINKKQNEIQKKKDEIRILTQNIEEVNEMIDELVTEYENLILTLEKNEIDYADTYLIESKEQVTNEIEKFKEEIEQKSKIITDEIQKVSEDEIALEEEIEKFEQLKIKNDLLKNEMTEKNISIEIV